MTMIECRLLGCSGESRVGWEASLLRGCEDEQPEVSIRGYKLPAVSVGTPGAGYGAGGNPGSQLWMQPAPSSGNGCRDC